MKYVRSLCGTVALMLAISLSAFADELDCPVVQPAPPPTTTMATTGAISISMTEIVVIFMEGVLSLS